MKNKSEGIEMMQIGTASHTELQDENSDKNWN